MTLNEVKRQFGIIGNSYELNRSLEKILRVADTEISVLITGESGVGKEILPRIIHKLSSRKHNKYIAINCGAIPEGTIDSELFGHEKGAFTGAITSRKGYFEVADGGTIFLDEVGELPLSTQVRLLRVLETGEFIKVGSSETKKTNVRIVAATNVNITQAINKNKFREDLYYRLSTVEISLPALRNRGNDIILLFKKFSMDFSDKYRVPIINLTPEAENYIKNYSWKGNIRQLKNIVEQLSIMELERKISLDKILEYLKDDHYPSDELVIQNNASDNFSNDNKMLYKVIFEMKKEINNLKEITNTLLKKHDSDFINSDDINPVFAESRDFTQKKAIEYTPEEKSESPKSQTITTETTLEQQEKSMIINSLERNKGNRSKSAKELGISERTLYRKIKSYEIEA